MKPPQKLTATYPHPANLGFCEFCRCKVMSPPEWRIIEEKYACGVGLIEDSVIFSLPWGRGSESGMLKYVEIMLNIFKNHIPPGRKVVIIDDFSQYNGISQRSRKVYIEGLKKCPQIAGLVCYNLSTYFRFNLGIGRRLHLVPYPIEFRDSYEDSIICASKILKRPIGIIDASNLTAKPKHKKDKITDSKYPVICELTADKLHLEYRKAADDTMLVNCSGTLTEKGVEEAVAYREKHMPAESSTSLLTYMIINLGKMQPTQQVLAFYANILTKHSTKSPTKLGVLLGEHVFTNATERFLNIRLPFPVVEAHSLNEAVTTVNCHRANSATPLDIKLPAADEIITKEDLAETMIHILSNTRWQIPGTFRISERYPPEHSLRILLDAIDTIKTDVDMTRRDQQQHIKQLSQASDEIKAREQQFRALFDVAADGILVIDLNGIINDCNSASTIIFQTTSDSIRGEPAAAFIPSIGNFIKDNSKRIRNGVNDVQITAKRKQGQSFPAHISLRLIQLVDEPHIIAYIHDSSESVAMQQAILDTASRITRRIGSDLHDSLGQKLVGISYLTQAIIRSLKNESPELKSKMEALLDVINDSVVETRALSHGLNPAEHTGGGFLVGLSRFMEKSHKMYSIECDVHIELCEEDIPHDTATHLYYILQESVNNAIRHGNASLITLHLRKLNQITGILTIKDNGKGFDAPPSAVSSGIGLKLMRYRMDLIGGDFSMESAPGDGTTLSYTFPLTTSGLLSS